MTRVFRSATRGCDDASTGDLLSELFEKIYVVSLARSHDRRAHIRSHFAELEIPRCEFLDAVDADDRAVDEAFEQGRVATYPPCFRCGRTECGDEHCNNVLTRPQIAVWLSYERLWRTICQRSDKRILVVEDDVLFHRYSKRVLEKLRRSILRRRVEFDDQRPTLMRLGRALSWQHCGLLPYRIGQTVRMSNPCHGITQSFAALMLEHSWKIDTTVDVFQNLKMANHIRHYTVTPPIASELSWSTGRFRSEIHPKQVRVRYLEKKGALDEAKEETSRGRKHVSHMIYRPVLITGHPRCGSEYAAKICRRISVDVRHEEAGAHGISSWAFAVDDDAPSAAKALARTRRAYAWEYLIHYGRDLTTAVPAVMCEDLHAPGSFDFRRKHIMAAGGPDLKLIGDPVARAVASIVHWSRIIERQTPNFRFRIEDQADQLVKFLSDQGLCGVPDSADPVAPPWKPITPDAPDSGKGRSEPTLEENALARCPHHYKEDIAWYCDLFGYSEPAS